MKIVFSSIEIVESMKGTKMTLDFFQKLARRGLRKIHELDVQKNIEIFFSKF